MTMALLKLMAAVDTAVTRLAHNHNCVGWADPAAVGAGAIEVHPGRLLCRPVLQGGQGTDSQMAMTLDGDCGAGAGRYHVAVAAPDCTVFWHSQAHNALPLPLMMWRAGDFAVCRTAGKIGQLVAPATCTIRDSAESLEGGYGLLGAYNTTAPYRPILVEAKPGSYLPVRRSALDRIAEMTAAHLDAADEALLERITGHSLAELQAALNSAPDVVVDRIFSSDRWVHTELNKLGMHLLRCMLAEKITDARRRKLGMHLHADYEAFMRDGVLVRDFSAMSNVELADVFRMVSGMVVL